MKEAQKIHWGPNNGPQTKFLACTAKEAGYGGAAGGGKTDGLLMGATRFKDNPNMRAAIFRKTFPMLSKIIDRSKQLYPRMGGRYNSSLHTWRFPAGGFVKFGNLEKPDQCDNYQGDDFTYIAFDELTQWGTDYQWKYMMSRLRTAKDSGIPCVMMRAAFNPGGRGHHWVKDHFKISDAGDSIDFIDEDSGFRRAFISARLKDNPFYAGTDYEKQMMALPAQLRKALLEGRWDIIAGAMFDMFNPRDFHEEGGHVCKPFDIPEGTEIWRGADDGFNAPACTLWFAKIDGRIFVIREVYAKGMSSETYAHRVKEIDAELGRPGMQGIMDSAAFADVDPGTGQAGTGRAIKMNGMGCRWRPCEKGKNSRVAGVGTVRDLLTEKLADGKPAIVFFNCCRNLIRTLLLVI